MGARASVIGVASHHHTAAIVQRETSRSASGVRSEIGSVLREGSVDYLLARHLPRGDGEMDPSLPPGNWPAAVRPRPRTVTLLDKNPNTGHQILRDFSAALETHLDAITTASAMSSARAVS